MDGHERQKESSKRMIEDALFELMAEKSYEKITVSELVKRADVARRTFYRLYGKKEDVLEAYFMRLYQEYKDRHGALQNYDVRQFSGDNEYHQLSFKRIDGEIVPVIEMGILTGEEQRYSRELKKLFPAYVNQLNLKDDMGNPVFLDDNGEGSFKDWVKEHVRRAAQKELETHDSSGRLAKLAVDGSGIEEQAYLVIRDGKVVDLDFGAFVKKITRMKKAPAFDTVDLSSPECEEFGTEEVYARHFTKYAYENSLVNGILADEKLVRMMNPLTYIGKGNTAKYWRIRNGAFDRDTSLAIPVILATILNNRGYEVDFTLPWGLPHSGDYDLKELFHWINGICKYQI